MNRNWADSPQERIENKLQEAEANKQKAVTNRVRELQRELNEGKRDSREMQGLKR